MAVKAVQHHKPKAAAAILGCSLGQIYNLLARGELAAVKLASSTLIRDDELARFQNALPKMKSHMRLRGAAGSAPPAANAPKRRGRPPKVRPATPLAAEG